MQKAKYQLLNIGPSVKFPIILTYDSSVFVFFLIVLNFNKSRTANKSGVEMMRSLPNDHMFNLLKQTQEIKKYN